MLDRLPYETPWSFHAQQEREAAVRWEIVCAGFEAWGGEQARAEANAAVKGLVDTHWFLAALFREVGEYESSHAPPTMRVA